MKEMVRNPATMMQNMMKTNPQFAQFVRQNQGKSAEQIASEYGIDIRQLNQLLRL